MSPSFLLGSRRFHAQQNGDMGMNCAPGNVQMPQVAPMHGTERRSIEDALNNLLAGLSSGQQSMAAAILWQV
jgi:hypothetical protein